MNTMILLLFLFGTIFGSFGSVLLRRLKDGVSRESIKGILYGRSMCPGCDKTLTPGQLVPLFGRLRQRGRCFRCGKGISTMYPVLELVSGVVFVMRGIGFSYELGVMSYEFSAFSILLLLVWWLLGLLLVWDMYTYELHSAVFIILVASVVGLLGGSVVTQSGIAIQIIWYAIVFLCAFGGIYVFGKRYSKMRFGVEQETFGLGDVLMAPVLGGLLAVPPQPPLSGGNLLLSVDLGVGMMILYFVLGSCLIGLLYYIIVLVYYKITKKDQSDLLHESGSPMIPFLPAMIICYWIMILL